LQIRVHLPTFCGSQQTQSFKWESSSINVISLHLPIEAQVAAGFAAVQGRPIGGTPESSAPSVSPSLILVYLPTVKEYSHPP